MFLPLAVCVVSLSSRFPDEGGIYVWSRRAFGPFAGFMTGWTYWSSNLPYFPGLLYFAAGNALFITHREERVLEAGPTYYVLFSLVLLAIATALNIRGLGVGKHLNNIGAYTRWAATLLLAGAGLALTLSRGSATPFTHLMPHLGLKEALFWSSIAFAWTGPEAASFMGGEIEDARRTVARALWASAPLTALIYWIGTASVLSAVPASSVNPLYGVLQALTRAEEHLGIPGLTSCGAILLTLTCLGSLGAWLEAVARIPFVAGLDSYLPPLFGRLHPRYGSPYVALLTQAAFTVPFVFLGQAGTTVRGAYEVLVSMTLLVTFIPFLLVFASAAKLHFEGPEETGFLARLVVPAAILGFFTTAVSIVLAVLPPPDATDRALAIVKILGGTAVLLAAGATVYLRGRKGGSGEAGAQAAQ
jgi:amino acid transporter